MKQYHAYLDADRPRPDRVAIAITPQTGYNCKQNKLVDVMDLADHGPNTTIKVRHVM